MFLFVYFAYCPQKLIYNFKQDSDEEIMKRNTTYSYNFRNLNLKHSFTVKSTIDAFKYKLRVNNSNN